MVDDGDVCSTVKHILAHLEHIDSLTPDTSRATTMNMAASQFQLESPRTCASLHKI